MARLINAPHLREQPNEPYSDLIILAGTQAWPAWDKGNGIEWLNLCDHMLKVRPSEQAKPIILNGEQLGNIAKVKIAPAEQRNIKIYQCGELTEAQKTGICANLATNSRAENVHLLDINTGELLENFSDYIERTRQGDSAAEIVTQSAQNSTQQQKTDNLSPYIEKRTENGEKGLYRITPKLDKDTGEMMDKCEWLADCVDVVGIGLSESDYFSMLSFQAQGKPEPILIALPWADIGERAGWQLLKQNGLRITNSQRLKPHLADFLQNTQNKPIYQIVNETGWQSDFNAYVLPSGEVLGKPDRPIYFNSKSATNTGYQAKGTLSDWQREIGQYLRGNHSMMLGVACSLSAPLIGLIGAESFGVHLFGKSSAGKTTIANIASSIYGEPDLIRLSWNGTSLGLINEAAARNDGFIPLDEIGQGASKKHVEQTAYALFNGVGKIQGAKDGGNRELNRWRILAFSTGEQDLELYLKQDNIKTNAGQLVRLLNIPITPASTFYHFGNGKAHADHLNAMTRRYYGTMGRAWIEWLLENKNIVTVEYERLSEQWQAMLPNDASSQVKRVAGRFAILETALQLAAHLTGWETSENKTALLHEFNEWINEYGLHSREEKQIIEQVNGWLLRNGARFLDFPFNPNQKEPNDTAGYRQLADNKGLQENDKYWVFPQVYVQDVIKGFNEKQANEILLGAGMLIQGKERGRKYLNRLPKTISGGKTIRCYVLEILNEDEESEEIE